MVKGIGAFVKYLVSYAAEGDDVPGLKAMVPGGAFVTELNKPQAGQPGPGTNWFVVSSNFHVQLFDDHHNPPEFPRGARRQARGGLRRPALRGRQRPRRRHRLDVRDRPARWAGSCGDSFALGENDVVYHNNYFTQLTRDRGDRGLAAAGPRCRRRRGGRSARRCAEPPAASAGPPSRLWSRSPSWPRSRRTTLSATVRAARSPPRRRPPRPRQPASRQTAASSRHRPPSRERRRRSRHPGASRRPGPAWPPRCRRHVVEKLEFVVRVRLSRNAIVATAGSGARRGRRDRRRRPTRSPSRSSARPTRDRRHRTTTCSRCLRAAGPASSTFTGKALAPGPCRGDGRRPAGHGPDRDADA